MEFIYALGRFPTDVLNHTILGYIYLDDSSVIKAGDLYALQRGIFPVDTIDINGAFRAAWAAKYGHLHILKWLVTQGEEITDWAIELAAGGGHLDCIKWLHEHGVACREDAMHQAVCEGHLDCMKWLYKHGVACTSVTVDFAAANGQLDCLKWLHDEVGAQCTVMAMHWAKRDGWYDVLEYLKEAYPSIKFDPLARCCDTCCCGH